MNDALRQAVQAQPLWYHTIDIAPGLATNGWFDLRPIVGRMPWPQVAGKRCLDVGTYDGFLAFELEKRGASEVVAIDIKNHEDWDWPPRARSAGAHYLRHIAGIKGAGFEIAASAIGSKVKRRWLSVYDLDPADVGTFDVVVCGDLLLHLRDPMRALEAIRNVCRGYFLSAEHVNVALTMGHPSRAVLQLSGDIGQWFIPNVTGHRHMLHTAGFDVVDQVRYAIPYGGAHPPPATQTMAKIRHAIERWAAKGEGQPTSAILAQPVAVPL